METEVRTFRLLLPFCAVVFLLLIGCGSTPSEQHGEWVLTLHSQSSHGRVERIHVEEGQTICYRFIHSYAKVLIEEFFIINGNGKLILQEAIYPELVAGYDTAPVSGVYELRNGKVHVSQMNIEMEFIPIRIGSESRQRLCFDGECVYLDELFDPGERVDISLDKNRRHE
ncbi:MAG: hypothetical protein DRP87_13210 [Spirochaetes bacterium]|nr:MAG: hypothetical protein DRP87_13210 [Spirochaetota bacterium]